jgi:RNA polymerase sigma-70 factor, ECF subfamily
MAASVAGMRGRVALDAMAAGDTRATAFVRSHFNFVWRTLRRFGVAESDADDAAQRVFVVATGRLDRIEQRSERAFLFGTAVRVADKVRRARSRRPAPVDADPDLEPSPWPSAEELVEQHRARALLDAILDEMSHDLRAVFVLYELEQMTVKDISSLLEIPLGTAASRLRRAREFFRERVRVVTSPHGEKP